jgi:hypothetical protein
LTTMILASRPTRSHWRPTPCPQALRSKTGRPPPLPPAGQKTSSNCYRACQPLREDRRL